MSDMARKKPSVPDRLGRHADEGSVIRARESADSARPPLESSHELRADAAAPTRRSHSSTRPATGSLDDRLEKKMRLAGELMRDLPSTDSRVRLLYIAIMRRDEALVDGVLAELNKTPRKA
jgi:hypothetical protein